MSDNDNEKTRDTEKKKPAAKTKKSPAPAVAALLAVSLPFGMLPLSAYAEATGESDPNPALVVMADGEGAASPNGVAPASDPAPAAAEPEDLTKILGDKGAAAYEKWLKGEELTKEELFEINVDALRPAHPAEADAIAAQQAEAKKAEEEAAAAEAAAAEAEAAAAEAAAAEEPAEPAEEAKSEPAPEASAAGEPEKTEAAQAAGTDGQTKSGGSDAAASGQASSSAAESASTKASPAPGAPKAETGLTVSGGASPAGAASGAAPADDHPQWSYSGDTSYTHRNPNLNLTTTKLIAVIGEPARAIAAENDLYASVLIAQAILESDSGKAESANASHFNLFGMRGVYRAEDTKADVQAGEEAAGDDAPLKNYPTYRESLADYAKLMSGDDYKQAHKSRAKDYAAACDSLEKALPNTKDYSKSLQKLIADYDLTRYDEPLGYKLAETYTMPVKKASSSGQETISIEERDLVDLISEASSHLGCAYVWGATGPDTFDCSGMVYYSHAQALGVILPRTSYYMATGGEDVNFKDLHMGDLLFFTNSKGQVNHVAMYLAEGCYIESTTPGGVQVTALDERTPTFAKRMLKTVPVEIEKPKEEKKVPALTKDAAVFKNVTEGLSRGSGSPHTLWGVGNRPVYENTRVENQLWTLRSEITGL